MDIRTNSVVCCFEQVRAAVETIKLESRNQIAELHSRFKAQTEGLKSDFDALRKVKTRLFEKFYRVALNVFNVVLLTPPVACLCRFPPKYLSNSAV